MSSANRTTNRADSFQWQLNDPHYCPLLGHMRITIDNTGIAPDKHYRVVIASSGEKLFTNPAWGVPRTSPNHERSTKFAKQTLSSHNRENKKKLFTVYSQPQNNHRISKRAKLESTVTAFNDRSARGTGMLLNCGRSIASSSISHPITSPKSS